MAIRKILWNPQSELKSNFGLTCGGKMKKYLNQGLPMKSSQGGWGTPDFEVTFTAFALLCAIGGATLAIGLPWLWEKLKPIIHAATA